MFGKQFFGLTTALFAIFTTLGCSEDNNMNEPAASLKGYWITNDTYGFMNQALTEDCMFLLADRNFHKTDETVELPIISIFGGGTVFAVDRIIKNGAVTAKAHPESVTALNIPGRFVLQGNLFGGFLTPAENDGFSIAPFDAEELEEQQITFSLDDSELLTMEIKPKPVEEAEEGTEEAEATDNAEVATAASPVTEESGAFEPAEGEEAAQTGDGTGDDVAAEEMEPFQLVYRRITLREYIDYFEFSQACLDNQ